MLHRPIDHRFFGERLRLRLLRASTALGFALGFGLFAAACGPHSDEVGAACRDDRDCVDRCLKGKDFPGGYCSLDCRDDRDCPGGTYCADKSGGVCLLACGDSRDCAPEYECKDVKAHGEPGDSRVCIGD